MRAGKGLGSRVFEQHHEIWSKACKRRAQHIQKIINVALLPGTTLAAYYLLASWILRDLYIINYMEPGAGELINYIHGAVLISSGYGN